MKKAHHNTLTKSTDSLNSTGALYLSAPFFACIGLVGALPWIAG